MMYTIIYKIKLFFTIHPVSQLLFLVFVEGNKWKNFEFLFKSTPEIWCHTFKSAK